MHDFAHVLTDAALKIAGCHSAGSLVLVRESSVWPEAGQFKGRNQGDLSRKSLNRVLLFLKTVGALCGSSLGEGQEEVRALGPT